ncbi:MAG: PIN domain-containing protein [Bacteroidota bacterium]|nr:PIN domain-containing protein [Bacteroidota bacterium]
MKKLKVYLDTSVINFLFADDAPDLQTATIDFFDHFIKTGVYDVYSSDFVLQEINLTNDPLKKEELIRMVEDNPLEILEIMDRNEIEFLAQQYIYHKVVPATKKLDALHIAMATVYKMNFLVSWNYKHLANVNRERKALAVNLQHNYLDSIRICTPLELLDYEK